MQHEEAAQQAAEGFNAGKVIIEHVSNSSIDHPLIHLPTIFGVNMSVTKHVLMLWLVAAVLFVVVTAAVRRYLAQDRRVPSRVSRVGTGRRISVGRLRRAVPAAGGRNLFRRRHPLTTPSQLL